MLPRRVGSWPLLLALGVACGPKAPPESAAPPEPASIPASSVLPATKQLDPDKVNADAADLIEKGTRADLDKAVVMLTDVVNAHPELIEPKINLGIAHELLGDLPTARGHFQAVIDTDPKQPEAWLYLGSVYERQQNLAGAAESYRQGIAQNPDDMALRAALVAVLRKQKKYPEAIAAAKDALGVNANYVPIYNNFGLVYMEEGNLTLARFIFQKALQSVPEAEKNAYIHCNLGWVRFLDGDRYTATKELKTAVELDPELVPALVYLSRIYMDDRNYGDTVPLLEKAATLDPENPDVQLTLGVAYRGVGRLDEAEAAYRKALQLDPGNPAPHFNLGVLLGDFKKDYDGAVAAFGAYVQAGGPEAALAQEYISEVEKEKARAEKRQKALEEKARKEEERKQKEKLLEEADKKPQEAPPPPPPEEAPPPTPEEAPAPEGAPAPEAPAPEEVPAPEEAPAPEAPAPETPEGGL